MLFSSTDISISLVNPPPNEKYDSINNQVSTRVAINFKETEKIYQVECGLLGSCNVLMTIIRRRYDPFRKQYINETHTISDTHEFLNLESKFIINPKYENDEMAHGYRTFTIPAGDTILGDFIFQIPNNCYFPSTYSGLNSCGSFEITYRLYVKIYKIGKLLVKKPKLLNSSILLFKYQSGKDSNISYSNNLLNYKSSQTFDHKVKKFYFDNEKHALIPTSIKENHRRTRFIRKLWNDDYKNENYNQITKSIPLKLDFSINSLFNIKSPVIDQLNLILSSDLNSIGIDSNQTTDFVFNGQSTHLGYFKIDSFSIILTYNTVVKCQNHYLRHESSIKILETHFKDLFMDIKDFDYDKENNLYTQSNLIERLISSSEIDLTQNLIELSKEKSILCSGQYSDWFENSVTMVCNWKITDGLKQKREYKFVTDSIPDIIIADANYMNNNNNIEVQYANNNDNNNYNDEADPPPPAYKEDNYDVVYDEKK